MRNCGTQCAEIVALAIRLLDDPRAEEGALNQISMHLAACSACHDSVDAYSRTGVVAINVGPFAHPDLYDRVQQSCHTDRAPSSLVDWMHNKGFASPAQATTSQSTLGRQRSGGAGGQKNGTGAVTPFE